MPRQFPYCTTYSIPTDLMFRGNFPTNSQVWNCLSHRNDCRQRGVIWVTYIYRCYNSISYYKSWTSVIRRSSVPPRAWVGPTTNWSQLDTVAKSNSATPWQFVVVEPNPSWWWPFKSPTNRIEVRTSSAYTAAIDASKQSKIRSSRSAMQ